MMMIVADLIAGLIEVWFVERRKKAKPGLKGGRAQ